MAEQAERTWLLKVSYVLSGRAGHGSSRTAAGLRPGSHSEQQIPVPVALLSLLVLNLLLGIALLCCACCRGRLADAVGLAAVASSIGVVILFHSCRAAVATRNSTLLVLVPCCRCLHREVASFLCRTRLRGKTGRSQATPVKVKWAGWYHSRHWGTHLLQVWSQYRCRYLYTTTGPAAGKFSGHHVLSKPVESSEE